MNVKDLEINSIVISKIDSSANTRGVSWDCD